MRAENERLIEKSEWRWVLGWGLAVVVLSSLPFLVAQFSAPPGYTFGGFIINVHDGNSYLAKMRQGYEGEWLFRLAFTPEDQRGLFVFTVYLALGHLARLTGLPLALTFHLARAASGLFLLFSVYRLAAEYTSDRAARRWAFAIGAFGSGLAVVSLAIGRSNGEAFVPIDLYIPEANGFYSILANPHFCLAFALEAWAIIWILNPPRWPLWAQVSMCAAIGLGIASLAPYLAPVAGVLVLAALFAMWERLATTAKKRDAVACVGALGLSMGLFVLYMLWAMRSDPAVAEWSRQNVTPSPPPLDVILGLGIWLPLAVAEVFRSWDAIRRFKFNPPLVALIIWLILSALLLYFPYPLQRRFLGGVFAPQAVLGGAGAAWLFARAGRWQRIATNIGIVVLGFSANVLVLAALFYAPLKIDPKLYLTDDEAAALRWLETQVTPDDVVLGDARMGLFIPGWTGARTVYGHPMETIEAAVKRAEVEAHYASGADDLLNSYRVKYVINGEQPDGWRVVFESGSVKVYGR
jgi:hypothetical protein